MLPAAAAAGSNAAATGGSNATPAGVPAASAHITPIKAKLNRVRKLLRCRWLELGKSCNQHKQGTTHAVWASDAVVCSVGAKALHASRMLFSLA
jgi:dTDP-4-amino-4,6-dideoxygalactose transaminase